MATLTVRVLEIPNGSEPQWADAERLVAEMSDGEATSAYAAATGQREDEIVGAFVRKDILGALEVVRNAWVNGGAEIVRCSGHCTQILIAGGTHHPEPEVCTLVDLFCASGLAAAAGFTAIEAGPKCRADAWTSRLVQFQCQKEGTLFYYQ